MDEKEKLKTLLEEQITLFKAFKEANDAKQKKYDVLLHEQTEKMTQALTELAEKSQKIEMLEAAIRRPGTTKEDKEALDKEKALYTKAFDTFLRKGASRLGDLELKALSSASDPDGGYWVDSEMSDFVVGRVFESSPVRQIARVETISSDALEMDVDDDQVASGWVGEQSARPETGTAKVGKRFIYAHELYANPKTSQKVLDDSAVDVERWLGMKVSEKFGRDEATAFVSGNGIVKPRGFLSYPNYASPGVYEKNAIERIKSGSLGAVTADGLLDTQNALKEPYQANAVWLMKRTTYGAITKLKDADGQYLLVPGLVNGRPAFTLRGNRVLFADDMPAIANDSVSIAYGDFSVSYTIVDRIGIRVLRDPFTAKPHVLFYTTRRVGGDVTNFEGLKLQVLSA